MFQIALRSILILSILLFLGCSGARLIAPLEKGEQTISVSLGGPLLTGSPLPIVPLGSLAYARGLGNNFSFSSGLNFSALIFKSIYVDPGLHWASKSREVRSNIPRLGLRFSAHSLLSLRDGTFIIYPEISPYLFLKNEKRSVYLGLENWIDPLANSLSEVNPKYWIYSIHSGWRWEKNKWHFQMEIKYNGINAPKNLEVLDIKPLQFGRRGGFGIYLGVARKIVDD